MKIDNNCLYFWDEVFSLIMLFGLTSSSRLFFSQRFGRLILRPSSGLSRTRELWNFEPNPSYSIKAIAAATA